MLDKLSARDKKTLGIIWGFAALLFIVILIRDSDVLPLLKLAILIAGGLFFLGRGVMWARAPKSAAGPAPQPAAPRPDPTPLRAAALARAPKKAPETADEDFDGDGVLEGKQEGDAPPVLVAARAGGADDLKRLRGVGPKLESILNKMGFYHFDQIAGWSADQVAWVDANLEGVNKGRASRDQWVGQAQVLASGGETEFSKRVDSGDVPSSQG